MFKQWMQAVALVATLNYVPYLRAAEFNYTSQDRSVLAAEGSPAVTDEKDAPDFGPFNAEADALGAIVTQTSSLTPNGFQVGGQQQIGGDLSTHGRSFFDVQFTIPQPLYVEITGFLTPLDFTTLHATLETSTSTIFDDGTGEGGGFTSFDEVDLLPSAGTYHFRLFADSVGPGDGGAQYSARVAVVPDPPAFWPGTVALAALGICLARRRAPRRC
jgi:hypothetical protein